MQSLRFVVSPNGRIRPQAFICGAIAVYLAGAASHLLTVPDILAHAGPWLFVIVQGILIWVWFVLHAQRLHDAGRGSGLAVGVALLYILSIALLLIVAFGFFNTSDGLMANPSANGALGLILLLYIISALAGSSQYDLGWAVIAILTLMAFLPIIAALSLTLWAATRPSALEEA
jgi:uncharacterized membrane protein YhaH (DUF805 family)